MRGDRFGVVDERPVSAVFEYNEARPREGLLLRLGQLEAEVWIVRTPYDERGTVVRPQGVGLAARAGLRVCFGAIVLEHRVAGGSVEVVIHAVEELARQL